MLTVSNVASISRVAVPPDGNARPPPDAAQSASSGLHLRVELVNHLIEFKALGTQAAPVIAVVIPLGTQFFDRFSKLLDPREILELMHTPLVNV